METGVNYLCDSCVLIEYLRGNESIYDVLVQNGPSNLSISTITMMELVIGAFNKREVLYIQKAFSNVKIIEIDKNISTLAKNLIIDFSKSHNLQINDALIAATAIETGLPLVTYNIADFRFIPNISLLNYDLS